MSALSEKRRNKLIKKYEKLSTKKLRERIDGIITTLKNEPVKDTRKLLVDTLENVFNMLLVNDEPLEDAERVALIALNIGMEKRK